MHLCAIRVASASDKATGIADKVCTNKCFCWNSTTLVTDGITQKYIDMILSFTKLWMMEDEVLGFEPMTTMVEGH